MIYCYTVCIALLSEVTKAFARISVKYKLLCNSSQALILRKQT